MRECPWNLPPRVRNALTQREPLFTNLLQVSQLSAQGVACRANKVHDVRVRALLESSLPWTGSH